jgi:hypothetical protein
MSDVLPSFTTITLVHLFLRYAPQHPTMASLFFVFVCVVFLISSSNAFTISSSSSRLQQQGNGLRSLAMGNNAKFGLFSPAVVVAKALLGDAKLNKIRGKAIALHSQAITEWCIQYGAYNLRLQLVSFNYLLSSLLRGSRGIVHFTCPLPLPRDGSRIPMRRAAIAVLLITLLFALGPGNAAEANTPATPQRQISLAWLFLNVMIY